MSDRRGPARESGAGRAISSQPHTWFARKLRSYGDARHIAAGTHTALC